MKKLLGLLIFSIFFSQILAAEALADSNLTGAKYWLEKLGAADVRYGYYEAKTKIIVVNKAQKTLQSFEYAGGALEQIFSQSVITGKSGDKFKEGDRIKLFTQINNFLQTVLKVTSAFYVSSPQIGRAHV